MKAFLELSATFKQLENGSVIVESRSLSDVEADPQGLGKKWDKLEQMQSIVANGTDRSLIEVFAKFKVDDDLKICALVHEEGSFYGMPAYEKMQACEPIDEFDLSWLPWNTGLEGVERPVFGKILIVDDSNGKDFQPFTTENLAIVIDAILEKKIDLI